MADLNNHTWKLENEHGSFLISTKLHLLDHDFINTAFGTSDMFWASPLPADQLAKTLSQSVTLGLYDTSPAVPAPKTADEPSSPRDGSPTTDDPSRQQQIGLARLVTDHVTFAYLSDVYIHPDHRGRRLFPWLIGCVRELLQAHPALRRAMLLTGSSGLRDFYAKHLGVWDVVEETKLTVMSRKGY